MARHPPFTAEELYELKQAGLIAKLTSTNDAVRQEALYRLAVTLNQGNRDPKYFDALVEKIARLGLAAEAGANAADIPFIGAGLLAEARRRAKPVREMLQRAHDLVFNNAINAKDDGTFGVGAPIKQGKSTTGDPKPFTAENFFTWGTKGILDRLNEPDAKKRAHYRNEMLEFASLNDDQMKLFAQDIYRLGKAKMDREVNEAWAKLSTDPDVKADKALLAQIKYVAEKARWNQGASSVEQIVGRLRMLRAAMFDRKLEMNPDGTVALGGEFPRFEKTKKEMAAADGKVKPGDPPAYPKAPAVGAAPTLPPITPAKQTAAYTPGELSAMGEAGLTEALQNPDDGKRQEAILRFSKMLAERAKNPSAYKDVMLEAGVKGFKERNPKLQTVIPDRIIGWWAGRQVNNAQAALDKAQDIIFNGKIERDPKTGAITMGDPLPKPTGTLTPKPAQEFNAKNFVDWGTAGLIERLNDPNPATRMAYRQQLFELGNKSDAELTKFANDAYRLAQGKMKTSIDEAWAKLAKEPSVANDKALKALLEKTGEIARYDSGASSPEQIKARLLGIRSALFDKKIEINGSDMKIAGDLPRGTATKAVLAHSQNVDLARIEKQGGTQLAGITPGPITTASTPTPTSDEDRRKRLAAAQKEQSGLVTKAAQLKQQLNAQVAGIKGVPETIEDNGKTIRDLITKYGKAWGKTPEDEDARTGTVMGTVRGGPPWTISYDKNRVLQNFVSTDGKVFHLSSETDRAKLEEMAIKNKAAFLALKLDANPYLETIAPYKAYKTQMTQVEKRQNEIKTELATLQKPVANVQTTSTQPRPKPQMPRPMGTAQNSAPPPPVAQQQGKPVASRNAALTPAALSPARRKELIEMSKAYLTGEGMKDSYKTAEARKQFGLQLAAILHVDPKNGLDDGIVGRRMKQAALDYLAKEHVTVPAKKKPEAAAQQGR